MNFTILLSLAASTAYAATFVAGAFPGSWAVKATSVALLAAYARRHPPLALALCLGATGDALLDLGPDRFFAGLLAFLAGHVVYAWCFFRHGRRTPPRALEIGLLVCAGAFLAWLWPALGDLRVPVVCYFAAIVTMVLGGLRVGGWVAIGALLFLASDMLLATDRFRAPFPWRDWLVWSTYYCGQFAIAVGFQRAPTGDPLSRTR